MFIPGTMLRGCGGHFIDIDVRIKEKQNMLGMGMGA